MKVISLSFAIPLLAMTTAVAAQTADQSSAYEEAASRRWKQALWADDASIIAQASSTLTVPQNPAVQRRGTGDVQAPLPAVSQPEPPSAVPQESAEDPQNYVGIHFGNHDVDEWRGRVDMGRSVQLDGRISLRSQGEAGLLVGREYERSRYELEYQLGRYQATMIELGPRTATVDGKGRYQALTLNAYRLKQLSERIDGYAGLGIGWGKAALPTLGFSGGCQCFANADDSGFIWQWRLGFEYLVGDNNELFMQYSRVMNIPGPVSAATAPGVVYEDKDIGTLAIGWRLRFEADGDNK